MSRASVLCLALVTIACSPRNSGPTPAPGGASLGPDRGQVVARIDGANLTAGEVEDTIEGDIVGARNEFLEKDYQLRSAGLDQLIRKKLLEKKAKAAGKKPEELLAAEVESKLTDPTEEELRALYDQAVAGGRELPPYEQVSPQIAEYVRGEQRGKIESEYYEALEKEAKVERLMEPLLLPKVKLEAIGPARGPAKAPVTIVEFSDFQCPYCRRAEPTVKKILDEYGDKVRFVYREFPLRGHEDAPKASEAALCAGDQNKYWEMHAKLFENQTALKPEQLKEYARTVEGLDAAKFDQCLDAGTKAAEVQKSLEDGQRVGVTGTPAFFVNGRPLPGGAVPYERFKEVIDAELAAAK